MKIRTPLCNNWHPVFFFDSRPLVIFSLLSTRAILRSSERLKQASTYHENTPLSNWGRLKEPADYSWSAVLHSLYSDVFPKSVHILGMLLLYRLICMVYGREALVLSSRSVWFHSNHVKAPARDATIIVRFASARSSGTQVVYQIWDFWYRGPEKLGNGLLNHNIYASLPPPPPPRAVTHGLRGQQVKLSSCRYMRILAAHATARYIIRVRFHSISLRRSSRSSHYIFHGSSTIWFC